MKDPKQQVSQSGRRFLRDAGVTGGIAVVAASTPGITLAQAEEGQDQQEPQEGYRLTQHVLAYYKSTAS